VNVVIAGTILLLGRPLDSAPLGELDQPGAALLPRLAAVNVSLVLFNLIPAFPLDGGRVLRALLAMALPYARATRIAATVGQALAVVFGLAGFFGNPMLLFIAGFIFLGAQQEATLAQMKDLATGVPVADAMVTHVVRLPPRATLGEAAAALLRTSQHEFPVVDAADRPLGVLTRDDLIAGLKQQGPQAPVAGFMRRDLPVVSAHQPFDDALRALQQCGCPALPVVDRLGRFAGLLTSENIGELLLVRSLHPADNRPAWRPVAAT
jgi:stage IV sporulation protein FB